MSAFNLENRKILVIEDHAEMRSSLKTMLDRMGSSPLDVANNGDDAIEYLRSYDYDLILGDYELGRGKDGQQVLEEARHAQLLRSGAIWIMITAAQSVEMVMGALEYHPDGYITKPVTYNMLESRLKRIFKYKQHFEPINNAIDAHQYKNALNECDRLIMVSPKLALATLRIKGKLLFDLNRIEEAKTVYQTVLDSREVAWAILGYCKCLQALGEDDEAIDRLETVIRTHEQYVECYDLLAKIFEKQGKLKRCEQVLVEAVNQSPKAILRQTQLSKIASTNNSQEIALKASRKAVNLSKNSCYSTPENYFNLAKALQHKVVDGGYREKTYALTEVDKVLDNVRSEFPNSTQIHIRAAALESLTLQNQKKEKEAKTVLMDAKKMLDSLSEDPLTNTLQDLATSIIDCLSETEIEELFDNLNYLSVPNQKNETRLKDQIKLITETRQDEQTEMYNNEAVSLFEKGQLTESIAYFQKALDNNRAGYGILLNAIQALVMLMKKNGKSNEHYNICQSYLDRAARISLDDSRYPRYQKLKQLFEELE